MMPVFKSKTHFKETILIFLALQGAFSFKNAKKCKKGPSKISLKKVKKGRPNNNKLYKLYADFKSDKKKLENFFIQQRILWS